ncbi:MAG: acyl-CoA thioesterase [Pararhodobacter sp.]|nr:acyl-CoA thioesterase [Pararhodobacter sp.]
MSYGRDIRIEFNHCDPAGIVFFPRYFEMINSMTENFFRDRLDYPFERIVMDERQSVPTVHLEIDFRAPSRLGELVRFTLDVVRLGRSSVDLRHRALGMPKDAAGNGDTGTVRLQAHQRLVWVDKAGRATPWPDELRHRFERDLTTGENDERA